MSIEKDKKPRKSPAKKAATKAPAKQTTAATKPKANASAKKAATKSKPAAKTVAVKPPKAAAVMAPQRPQPTHEQIAELAYSYYIRRGWQHGHHEQDWLQAEWELSTH